MSDTPTNAVHAIDGYIESIGRTEIRGWALDLDNLDKHLSVEILCDAQTLGHVTADVQRSDLQEHGYGRGDHGFVFSFPRALDSDQRDLVWARVVETGRTNIELPKLAEPIDGCLEVVTSFQARGWAFDRVQPSKHLSVEILCDAQTLGRATASLYRSDLQDLGYANGDHGFVLNFSKRVPERELGTISAYIVEDEARILQLRPPESGPGTAVDKPTHGIKNIAAVVESSQVVIPKTTVAAILRNTGSFHDEEQYPIFVLGATRSGTSAMAYGLIASTKYYGYEEGHLFDVLALLSVTVDRFYAARAIEWSTSRNTMIDAVPVELFEAQLDALVASLARQVFPVPYWIDKTPNSNMIRLAPRFLNIWPNARFIFMKRRAIEQILSSERKFGDFEFGHCCRQWADVMETWASVRDFLQPRALEIDQMTLARQPETVAKEVASFLQLSDDETARLIQAFAHDRPQRSSDNIGEVHNYADLHWDTEKRKLFEKVCGPAMDQFGYSKTVSYADSVTS